MPPAERAKDPERNSLPRANRQASAAAKDQSAKDQGAKDQVREGPEAAKGPGARSDPMALVGPVTGK